MRQCGCSSILRQQQAFYHTNKMCVCVCVCVGQKNESVLNEVNAPKKCCRPLLSSLTENVRLFQVLLSEMVISLWVFILKGNSAL